MKRVGALAAALVTLGWIGSVRAHHSISMFDLGQPIWIKGTVGRFDIVNPHVTFTLEQRNDDGRLQQWTVEGPGLNSFSRAGLGTDFVKPGDPVEVCGFALKKEVLARSSGQDARGAPRPALHGHVLVMSEGRMRLFGGYGKLANCVRPTDPIDVWLTFLATDSRARTVWCNGRVFADAPTVVSQAFVDEVNRLMANPCTPLAER